MPEEKQDKGKDNKVYIGIKPFMNYVTAVSTQFKEKKQDEVFIVARGKFISRAVDVVEVARRTFLKDENIKIADIKISSQEFKNRDNKPIHVSTIDIKLIR